MVDTIKLLSNRGVTTPDFSEFKKKENVLLFVYDSYKTTEKDYKFLKKHSKYLGEARSAVDCYNLKSVNDDKVILFDEQGQFSYRRGYIRGEVFAVSPEVIVLMDEIMSNKMVYDRVRRNFLLQEQEVGIHRIQRPYSSAFVYLGRHEFWDGMVLKPSSSYMVENKRRGQDRFFDFMGKRPIIEEKKEIPNYVDVKYPLLNDDPMYGGYNMWD